MYKPTMDKNGHRQLQVSKRGYDVVRDPLLNKGTAFTAKERLELGLEGLLPHEIHKLPNQIERVYRRLSTLDDDLKKFESVNALQDRNEQLFYSLLCSHLEELMPIIYTPTVGLATRRYSHVFRRARGVWITPNHQGRIKQVLENAARNRQVRLMVVTDNESILGIGDQGAGGMAISIGKLSLYCAGAGIHPSETLPVSLDVGTENSELLDDPLYLGWRQRRLRGQAYDDLVEEFVMAVKATFPQALVQWEDFRKDNALNILDRYKHVVPSFNDDIQGTGAVALAGIMSAIRISGQSLAAQRIVILGAGAAGLGIARQIKNGLAQAGVNKNKVAESVAVLDSRGLLINDGGLSESYKAELAWSPQLAKTFGFDARSDRGLLSVIKHFKPTVLIGSSGQAGAFTQEMIETMCQHVERPLVMPFSNPNDLAEARPKDLYDWSRGKVLVATGSPFADVHYKDKVFKVGQGNNAFIFPGLGLGALIAQATQVTPEMISVAADALAHMVSEDELATGLLFPTISRLREVSAQVAVAVIRQAAQQQVGVLPEGDLNHVVKAAMWDPVYPEYIPA